MAIMDCNECGEKVSTTAKACPHCGGVVPNDPQIQRIQTIIAWVILLTVAYFMFNSI